MKWFKLVIYVTSTMIVLVPFMCYYLCRRRRNRHQGRIISQAPVVVTTATTQPFTPYPPAGQPMQQTIIPSNQHYPPQTYGMPNSYPMPQPGYHPYSSGGAPYPPAGPLENMNPPSYDQVVGTAPTTTTNESYAKQAPYNPNYSG